MKIIKITDFDYIHSCFHFSRINNRESIEKHGLQAVAGGENKTINDSENPTIYFSYGIEGILKAIDVWIKWEYTRLIQQNPEGYIPPYQYIDETIMDQIYKKIYEDFKQRMYFRVQLREGKNAKDSDFSFQGIDRKN